jgi:Tfp pilus assembly protein FimT
MTRTFKKRNTKSNGALLLELLIVIALLAAILSVTANATFLSLRSNKISGERDIATALAAETLESARTTAEEDWQNIYSLTKGSQHYHGVQSGTKWTLATADETVTLNGVVYTRYVTIDNVSRDGTTRAIQTTYTSADDDPSTQKATAVVSWSGGNPVTISEYFLRWRNKTCAQSAWTTGGTGNTVKLCSDASYDTKDSGMDTSSGSLKLQ